MSVAIAKDMLHLCRTLSINWQKETRVLHSHTPVAHGTYRISSPDSTEFEEKTTLRNKTVSFLKSNFFFRFGKLIEKSCSEDSQREIFFCLPQVGLIS